jgi:hypothetical protein
MPACTLAFAAYVGELPFLEKMHLSYCPQRDARDRPGSPVAACRPLKKRTFADFAVGPGPVVRRTPLILTLSS